MGKSDLGFSACALKQTVLAAQNMDSDANIILNGFAEIVMIDAVAESLILIHQSRW